MILQAIEQKLRVEAGAVLVDPRLLRRIIKHDRGVPGVAPHEHCYPIGRETLLAVVSCRDLGLQAEQVPDPVILIARPSLRELRARSEAEVLTRLWRSVFHCRVHLALEEKFRQGELDDARVRMRIEAIGLTEFDEIRAVLRHDELVLPPGDDGEVYREFAAVYLELRYFSPHLLRTTFPGLSALELVDGAISEDVEHGELLMRGKPDSVTTELGPTGTLASMGPLMTGRAEKPRAREVSSELNRRLVRRARAAMRNGNDAKAALLGAMACGAVLQELRGEAEQVLARACENLGKRLNKALGWENESTPPWEVLFAALAKRDAAQSAHARWLTYGAEARVLATIQRALVQWENPPTAVDLSHWVLSLGKKPAVRALPATRELRLARTLKTAVARVHRARMVPWEQKPLANAVALAQQRAAHMARETLRPLLRAGLTEVGINPTSMPERLACDKLVEELLDQCLDAGFVTFSQLRDALSRNQLKLDDLSGAQELWQGDALLRADRELAERLDGVYRRGDVYLRGMQKATSLPLGTRVGRAVSLYVLLPVGAAFIVIEGLGHVVGPVMKALGYKAPSMLTWTSMGITSALVFGLLHNHPFRAFALQVVEVLGIILAWVFFRLPRAILTLPAVQRWLMRPAVRLVLRRIVVPLLLGLVTYFVVPIPSADWLLSIALSLSVFVVVSLLAGTRVGRVIEDYVVEQVVPTWQVLSRQWLPGVFKWIVNTFAVAMDLLQRGIFSIDELLRYRHGNLRILTGLYAVLGLVWAMIAYVLRVYITLLVEPELNPLKHFPIITVCHKLFLPVTPQVLQAMQVPLAAAFGTIVGGAVAGVTVFLLPSISGFFAWELKENYKLYRTTLPDQLRPARIGHHGETMRGLMIAGFHSGTVPKLYQRLRRAAAREHEQALSPIARVADGRSEEGSGVAKFRQGIAQVQEALRHFVERELIAYLRACPRWKHGPVTVGDVELSSHRIRIQLFCEKLSPLACDITFEQTAGLIIAGIPSPGFVGVLARLGQQDAIIFENALAGLYQQAEVDLVREQIEAQLGASVHYEISEDGLSTWVDSSYQTECIYRLDVRKPKALAPKIKGPRPSKVPPVLDTRRILFRQQAISRVSWESAWLATEDPNSDVPRLVSGTSLLPTPAVSSHDLRLVASASRECAVQAKQTSTNDHEQAQQPARPLRGAPTVPAPHHPALDRADQFAETPSDDHPAAIETPDTNHHNNLALLDTLIGPTIHDELDRHR